MTAVDPILCQEKTDPRSENRVVGSPRSPAACAWSFLSEPVELHQENGSTGTATVSGVWCWLAKDPILFAGGYPNLYAYCANEPVNALDPTGLEQQSFTDCMKDCLDKNYGSSFDIALDLSPFSLAGLLEEAYTSIAEFLGDEALKNAPIAGAIKEGSLIEKMAAAADEASMAKRLAPLMKILGPLSKASGVVGAAASGYVLGALAYCAADCALCDDPPQK